MSDEPEMNTAEPITTPAKPKKRGRPPGAKAKKKAAPKAAKTRTAAGMGNREADVSHLDLSADRATVAHTPDRPARVRMGASAILDVPFELDTKNFYYRWFRESRVAQATQAYYETVTQPESGEAFTRTKGEGISVLMRLPIKYRLEDLMFKRKNVINTLADNKTGGIGEANSAAPEYSGLEGRKGAIKVEGGFDADEPYNAYT